MSPSTERQRLLAEATNPKTPASRLRELAQATYRDLRGAVASNPNTPAEVLSALAFDFPVEVTNNASWALVVLVEPARQSRVLAPLARDCDDPVRLLALAREGDAEVRMFVANNPAAPIEALWFLATREPLDDRSHKDLRLQVAAHPTSTPELLAHLAVDVSHEVRQRVLRHPAMRVDDMRHALASLTDHHHIRGLGNLAANPAAPAELLQLVASHEDSVLRRMAAAHRRTPGEALAQLALDSDPYTRLYAVSNPSTPPAALDAASRSPSVAMRRRVARNPSSGSSTLLALACQGDAGVRRAVARNPSTPTAALQHIRQGKRDEAYLAARLALQERGEPLTDKVRLRTRTAPPTRRPSR